jgi:acyl transferase domain-containing protein
VNNFGYGGSNSHIIMEDYASFINSTDNGARDGLTSPYSNGDSGRNTHNHQNGVHMNGVANGQHRISMDEPSISGRSKSRVFILSAKDEKVAQTMVGQLQDYLRATKIKDNEDRFLGNLAFTLGQRRTRFHWNTPIAASNLSSLIGSLGSEKLKATRAAGKEPRLGFVFTGQGAQWWAMGRELIEAYPSFKSSLMEAQDILRNFGCPWSLIGKASQSNSFQLLLCFEHRLKGETNRRAPTRRGDVQGE